MVENILLSATLQLVRQKFNTELEVWQPPDINTKALENLSKHLFPATVCGRCFRTGGIFTIDPRGNVDQLPNNGLNFGAHLNGNPEGYFALRYRFIGDDQWERFPLPIIVISGERESLFNSLVRQDQRFAKAVNDNRFC